MAVTWRVAHYCRGIDQWDNRFPVQDPEAALCHPSALACQGLLRSQFRGLKCGLGRECQAAPLAFEKPQFGVALLMGGVKTHGLTASRAQRKSISAN
jgi:hypothetical protein